MPFAFTRLPNELKSKVLRQVYLEDRQHPQDLDGVHPLDDLSRVSKEFRRLCARCRFDVSFENF